MAKIKFAALDGSLRNFGIALMEYDTEKGDMEVLDLILVKTAKSKAKTIRVSSDRLARTQELAGELRDSLKECSFVFAEIPTGAQDANSAYSFGIVTGLYGSLTIPLTEVTPTETKMAAVGTRTASKQEMIEWATAKFPNAPWRTKKRDGELSFTLDNEHLADAVAIAFAGIKTPQFRQTAAMFALASK